MAKTNKSKGFEKLSDPEKYLVAGPGGATRQTADAAQGSLTTNQGVVAADNQNTLNSGGRDPSLPGDIPERIVHARGSGAHGYFEAINPIPHRRFALVKESLARAVETAISIEGERAAITPYQAPGDLDPSPALSLVGKAKGRKISALVTDGADGDRVEALRDALEQERAEFAIVAPKIGGVRLKSGKHLTADLALAAAPSVFFDGVAIFGSAEGIKQFLKNSAAPDWVRGAFGHLKVIRYTAAAQPVFAKPGIADDLDEGVIELDARASIGRNSEAAKHRRVWDREVRLSESDA